MTYWRDEVASTMRVTAQPDVSGVGETRWKSGGGERHEGASLATPADVQKSLNGQADEDLRNDERRETRLGANERRSGLASRSPKLHAGRSVSRFGDRVGEGWWENGVISGSGGVFGGSPHRTGEKVQKRNCSGTEGSKNHQSGAWLARNSDGTVVSSSVNMNSLAHTYFLCAQRCGPGGLRSAGSARSDLMG